MAPTESVISRQYGTEGLKGASLCQEAGDNIPSPADDRASDDIFNKIISFSFSHLTHLGDIIYIRHLTDISQLYKQIFQTFIDKILMNKTTGLSKFL